jgi:predicted PurR-regulated permease PerM
MAAGPGAREEGGSRRARPSVARVVTIALAVVALGAIFVLGLRVLLVLFAGVLLALVLAAAADFVARHTRAPRWAALALVVVTLLALVVVALVSAVPAIAAQVSELARELPTAIHALRARLVHLSLVAAPAAPNANGGPDANVLASSALTAVTTSVEVVGGLVVIFFVGVYGAAQPRAYLDVAVGIAPEAHKERLHHALRNASHDLTRWLLGRLVAMLFVGVTSTIAFVVLGVPLALTLGLLAGLLTFVEYIGAIASAIPPALLAFTKSPTLAVAVLGIFTVLHVIEGYVLTPLLARATVRIPPAFALAGQLVAAAIVGPLGLTFATPLLVVIASAVRAWRGGPSAAGAANPAGAGGAAGRASEPRRAGPSVSPSSVPRAPPA